MEVFIVKSLGVLKPYTAEDADLIRSMREGEVYRAKVSMPRNVKFHRKYFSLLSLVYDNLPEHLPLQSIDGKPIRVRSVEDLLWHIKMQLGHYERRMTLGGRVTYEAKSISFAAMDEAEFSEFYDRSLDVILRYFLPETNREELEEIIALTY